MTVDPHTDDTAFLREFLKEAEMRGEIATEDWNTLEDALGRLVSRVGTLEAENLSLMQSIQVINTERARDQNRAVAAERERDEAFSHEDDLMRERDNAVTLQRIAERERDEATAIADVAKEYVRYVVFRSNRAWDGAEETRRWSALFYTVRPILGDADAEALKRFVVSDGSESSSGRTPGFGPGDEGSTPSSEVARIKKRRRQGRWDRRLAANIRAEAAERLLADTTKALQAAAHEMLRAAQFLPFTFVMAEESDYSDDPASRAGHIIRKAREAALAGVAVVPAPEEDET